MDGTIVDTEPYWMRAESELVGSFGRSWSHEDAFGLVGADLWHAARIFQSHGVDLSEDAIIARLTDRVVDQIRVEIPWRPGARELLLELSEAGIPCALVTMSLHRMAEHVVSAIDFNAFAAVVGGDDIVNGKPHPEPYLHGAALLGVDVSHCIALEDSPNGISSAVASGAVTIGIPAHVDLPDSADYALWPTLSGRTVADLSAHFASAQATVA